MPNEEKNGAWVVICNRLHKPPGLAVADSWARRGDKEVKAIFMLTWKSLSWIDRSTHALVGKSTLSVLLYVFSEKRIAKV